MIITVTLNASIDKTTVINNFQIGKINRSDKPLEFAGGKGLNVSRALKNLDYNQSLATGFIGGKNGERLKKLIEKEKINHDFPLQNRLSIQIEVKARGNIWKDPELL